MEHKTIKVPKELLASIEEIIEKYPELGYVSSTEFIKEAVRTHLRETKRVEQKK